MEPTNNSKLEKLLTSTLKLGIIAGGQLGKMLIQEASKWNINSYVMDNDEDCPAGKIASQFVKGSNVDFDSVYHFGKLVNVLTYELENINIEALKKLKAEGCEVIPDPKVLELIQDKGLQKQFYASNSIPTASFKTCQSKEEIFERIESGEIKLPFVQKLRSGGYDGRGVAVIKNQGDLVNLLPGASVIEEVIKIQKEVAVIVARNRSGQIKSYPPVEMVFDHKANLVDKLFCPSTITPEQANLSIELASRLIELLDVTGLLAVEFFIDAFGKLLVNEVAPRPHNSGHHTIESAETSQFEQHLRAILDLPLGSTSQIFPSVMVNLLGEEGHHGPVFYEGLIESMAMDGVNVHLYGKKLTRPFRKMGHVTIVAPSLDDALEKSEKIKKLCRVKSVYRGHQTLSN